MVPDYTAVCVTYLPDTWGYSRKTLIVQDAELVEQYGYIEVQLTSTNIGTVEQAQHRGERLLRQVRQSMESV